MGMYTEFFFRAELKKDAPEALVEYLKEVLDPDVPWSLKKFKFDDHPFFNCLRWQDIFASSSYSHPYCESKFHASDGIRPPSVEIHSSLKNYTGEISGFVDWILPWLNHYEGDFLGYSLYEDSRPDGYGSDQHDRDRPELIFMPELPAKGQS